MNIAPVCFVKWHCKLCLANPLEITVSISNPVTIKYLKFCSLQPNCCMVSENMLANCLQTAGRRWSLSFWMIFPHRKETSMLRSHIYYYNDEDNANELG